MSIYQEAKARYAEFGIDTDAAISAALQVPISLHCWQTDDVGGFETRPEGLDGGGIMATGNYPGRARTGDEARADLAKAMSLIPGAQRVNIHACYSETDHFVDRDQLDASCFATWIAWAKDQGICLDFNPTFFAHPKAEDGFTLSHQDDAIRAFWVRHGKASRKIAEAMADAQGAPCCVNWWTPDGSKDAPADRFGPRRRMAASYDEIFRDDTVDSAKCVDFLESKLFGIGSEAYVVSSAEFCSDYALRSGIGLCLDMGHFHPTETIDDKLSSHLQFLDRILLHVSRPMRWDSDHVVRFNDDLRNVFLEIARGKAWDRVVVALDFFDASINRIGAYVTGTRAARKGILYALLDPTAQLQAYEAAGQNAQRLALMEAFTTMPFGAVWDQLCEQAEVPVGAAWLADMEAYERTLAVRQPSAAGAGRVRPAAEQLRDARVETITALSHQFGTSEYVRGGGGNTSVKDATTLWVKPSGTTLAGLEPATFVALERTAIERLYDAEPPADASEREEMVKNLMAGAVVGGAGRPSVEAPLHNALDATYVVHTHPALVNGMTCAKDGEAACRRLFPEALWMEYVDPGYTLCMALRERLQQYRAEFGAEPNLLVLQNHGIFVAADTPEEIRAIHVHVIAVLRDAYAKAGVSTDGITCEAVADCSEVAATLAGLLGDDAAAVVGGTGFECVTGPVSPDHMVYARAFPYLGPLTQAGLAGYREERGYAPKVVVADGVVYGLGSSARSAALALELALDRALVCRLAEAFGGVRYLSDPQRRFIENWEVESYRQKQMAAAGR